MDRSEPVHGDAAELPISLPPHPPEPAAAGFPVLATIAPIAGALVLWMITGSAISLAFAALGPLVAVASVLDARRLARRARRRGDEERAAKLESVRAQIDDRHAVLRAAAWRRTPSARHLAGARSASAWRDGTAGSIVLGRGPVTSGLRVDGTPVDAHDRELLEHAARLEGAPVLAAAQLGIGVVGPLPLARAAARALVLQLAHRCRPGVVEFSLPDEPSWSWAEALPHHRGGGTCLVRVLEAREAGDDDGHGTGHRGRGASQPPDAGATIAVAEAHGRLPHGLGAILVVENHGRAVVEFGGGDPARATVVPELLGASEASLWAAQMRSAAARAGFGGAATLPTQIDLDALRQPESDSASRGSLRVAVGMRHGGELEIDLVAGGPHAIVAGTTGSGKSEFLLAWLAALAHCHPPSRVAFLLVDFKGGAAFEPIRSLPHVAGIVTDLDEAEAERAVLSLRAELRYRESVLHAERARDIIELEPDVELARLVIVVDEFQAMIERFPDLGAVIADIAARGRSLGVHLVLASQRPNGVVREQVTANCAIRVSLRVMQRADSIAVVGTEAAASIRPDSPGRGIIDVGDGMPVAFQSARVDARSLAQLRRAGADAAPARRPWVDPLPDTLPPEVLDSVATSDRSMPGALEFGLVDEPERQRHGLLAWSPLDGHLLVAGAPGSGRTTALAAIARAAARHQPRLPVVRLDGPPSRQWDTVQAMQRRVAQPGPPALLLVDDLDLRFRDWPDEHRHSALIAIEAILRDGRRNGVGVVATAAQAHRLGHGIREAFGGLLLLRHPSRADLVHAGGSGGLWRDQDPPGCGQWRGHRVQLIAAPPLPDESFPAPLPLDPGGTELCAVVSASPRADVSVLRESGLAPLLLEPVDTVVRAALARRSTDAASTTDAAIPTDGVEPCVIVGDADAWAANWTIAALVREEATIVVHGGARECRVLAADSSLPPLLDDAAAQCWVRRPGAPTERAAWPPVPTTETVAVAPERERKPHASSTESNDSDMIA
ncbi:FtsK/SpoIIIE domain-containing protein [Agromyces sp. NPDC058484]|uniref:FtsK/SpoIIIE domain-containing protein n=1 Tax=Agromyces sp. NPDC058484 TaxID=3346524 RepID=UPI00364FAD73